MNYADIRPTLKSGDLLAWSHRKWGSLYDLKIQAVRFFTQSEYSHVGVCWVVGGRVFVIEAVVPFVRIYPLSKLGDFYHVPMDAPWAPDTEEAALNFVGSRYSQLQAVIAFFKARENGNVSECAALALEIYMRDGIYLGDRATPDAVMREAQRLGHATYLISNP